jgi:hypothetical protein
MSGPSLRALVDALVLSPATGPALRDAVGASLRGRDCAALLRDLRDDPELNFVIYEVPRDVCSKPREMLAWLLERLVGELRDERIPAVTPRS